MGWDWKFPKYSKNWDKISEACKRRDGYRCKKCGAKGRKAGGSITLQACHIVSKRKGGQDVLSNLVTKCVACHTRERGHSHMKANPSVKKELKRQKKKKKWIL